MNLNLFSSLLAIIIPILVFLAAWILSNRTQTDREKSSPFECGFDPKSAARIPFSIRFFLLAIIFIVFDIEIVLLMPVPLLMINKINISTLLAIILFIIVLVAGLLHEWNEGSLDWSS